jgi:putative transposase
MSTTYPSNLSDAEWTCVQRYLPPLSRRGRPRTHPLRRILDAIFYIVRSGWAWRYLPSNFPPWQTVFYHFRRLRLQGKWHRLYTALHRAERERVGRHPDPSAAIMDSQSVKTVEESASICGYDAHKCVKGRKRHLLVDTLGLPIACYVTPADVHDTVGARKVLGGLAYFVPRLKKIWADAALPGPGVGRLVSAAGRVGAGGRRAPAGLAWLQRPTTSLGRGAQLRLVSQEPATRQGLRALGADERDTY